MKKFVFLYIFFLLVLPCWGYESNDFWYQYSSFFGTTADPNAGLTAFPTLSIPSGGRYAGMGTAYTAVARDSGFLQANPSGSALLEYTELSFLHNNWIADTNIEGIIYTARYEDLGIGVGGKFLYVPFTAYDLWGRRTGKGYYSESVAVANISYNFLSDYYFHGISVGANVKLAYRHVPESIYPGQSALMAMIDLGALTRLNFLKFYSSRSKNLSVGLAIKNIGPYVTGDPLPLESTLGLAYAPIRPVLTAYDITLPLSFTAETHPAEQISMAGGVDVTVADFLALQGGLRLRRGNPGISLGSIVNLPEISFHITYTLDMTTELGALDRFNIEAKLNLGDMGRGERIAKRDEAYVAGLEAYANGELEKAIMYWEKVLTLDPDYIPARENIKTTRKALELQNTMRDLQRVE